MVWLVANPLRTTEISINLVRMKSSKTHIFSICIDRKSYFSFRCTKFLPTPSKSVFPLTATNKDTHAQGLLLMVFTVITAFKFITTVSYKEAASNTKSVFSGLDVEYFWTFRLTGQL